MSEFHYNRLPISAESLGILYCCCIWTQLTSSRPIYACIAASAWLEQDAAQILTDAMRGSYDPEEGFTSVRRDREKGFETFQRLQALPNFAKSTSH